MKWSAESSSVSSPCAATLPAVGFSRPVHQAQAVFKAAMTALARPGVARRMPIGPTPPPGLTPSAWSLLLTLADADAPIWLSPSLTSREACEALLLHTGAPVIQEAGGAAFAVVDLARDSLDLSTFAQGESRYPDRSATVIAQAAALVGGDKLRLYGPGLKEPTVFAPRGLPPGFPSQWAQRRGSYPLGVDLFLVSGDEIAGLPRSIDVAEAA
jgi:alpha-D-ribose 1-methylphosphonate 5-triphosphate synthase subunit PhnH